MSWDWDAPAVGLNVLYGAVIVTYGPDSSGSDASFQLQPALEGSYYGPPRKWQSGLAMAAGDEMSPTAPEPIDSSLSRADYPLSGRQLDVLRLIVQGRSNKEIARALSLAEGTVKIHVAGIFSKLGLHRRAAVAVAGARFFSEASLAQTR